jgi:hypothetical protein
MEGGLRRPYRPLQVIGVLAAVLATALISLQFTPPDERAGARPIPDKPNLGALGERLNANTIAIVPGNPNATYLSIGYDMSDAREKQSAIMTDAGSASQPSPATERPRDVGRPPQMTSFSKSSSIGRRVGIDWRKLKFSS